MIIFFVMMKVKAGGEGESAVPTTVCLHATLSPLLANAASAVGQPDSSVEELGATVIEIVVEMLAITAGTHDGLLAEDDELFVTVVTLTMIASTACGT